MIYFLSSIPRSGSTLLSALLNQRTDTYVSPTSGLCDTMGSAITSWEQNPATHASGSVEEDGIRMLRAIAEAHYANHSESIIIDKGRGWPTPGIMSTMTKVQGDIKIIATVRPIRECLASFIKIAKPKNVKEFCKDALAQHLFSSYSILKAGYETTPENFLIIEYNDLVKNPQIQLDRVADFLSIPKQKYNLKNISPVEEDDKIWGIKNLHKVRKTVRKRNYNGKKLLGEELWNHYIGGEFWNDKPIPKRSPQLLDLQLEAGLHGNFEEGWKIAQQLPDTDDRAAFNKGWYLLRQGKLLEGHRLLDRGRIINVFGNRHIGSAMPIWNGKRCGTVLLNLEGGLGDQIHGIRWAKNIAERGNKVTVACSAELSPLFVNVDGVSSIVQHEASLGVYHDAWLPSMSAVVALGYEYNDINGRPYIPRPYIPRAPGSRGKIGLRWSGNPQFEHEQHRIFPSELLFNAVKGLNCISLQRDNGLEDRPSWVAEVSLNNWIDTANAIATCDLVISSCTSVAHLSAAMGIKTWIITPILSYYLWALPGETTPYYNSIRLFRQEKYGDWEKPFQEIKNLLS